MTDSPLDDVLPAVAGVVPNTDDELLFVHNEVFDAWTLPMTPVEPGESLTEALEREVSDTAGIDVSPAELAGIYSDPNVQSVEYEDGEIIHYVTTCVRCETVEARVDPDDPDTPDARFFPRDDTPYLGFMQRWLETALDPSMTPAVE